MFSDRLRELSFQIRGDFYILPLSLDSRIITESSKIYQRAPDPGDIITPLQLSFYGDGSITKFLDYSFKGELFFWDGVEESMIEKLLI